MIRTIVIGDIHGNLTELKKLMAKLHDYEQFIFLGDYIDRGKDSSNVVDFLIDLSKKKRCIFLKGNHEQLLLDYLESGDIIPYAKYGGLYTIKSYLGNSITTGDVHQNLLKVVPESHLHFFKELRDQFEEMGVIYIHNINALTIIDSNKLYIHGHSESNQDVQSICLDHNNLLGQPTILACDPIIKRILFSSDPAA